MKLSRLLQPYISVSPKDDCTVKGLSDHSQRVKPGDVFFATLDQYIDEAVANGASAIICESKPDKTFQIPVFELPHLSQHIGLIASNYYHHPSQKMRVIGVTGTNGKTSCTHFIAQALKMAGMNTGVIGTLGNGMIHQLTDSTLTTPTPLELQKLLFTLHQNKADVVAMETSSHGLEQGRTNGTQFFLGAFTNLSHEHLDYHGTMENYARAKMRLFEQEGLSYAVLNADDPKGLDWIKILQQKLPVYTYSTQHQHHLPHNLPMICTKQIQLKNDGLLANLCTPWGEGVIHTPLLGKFNMSNLLLVITVLGIMEIPFPEIIETISKLKSIPGRMEKVGGENNQPLVIIDYAHTPDALTKALQALREHCKGNLWCVFGCGGERDKTKRPEMGRIAEQLADEVVITDDNPRNEDSLQIINDICQGLLNKNKVLIEHNRRRAIQHAITCAKSDDIILIAGKGHENYQIIGNEKLPFSDMLEVKMHLYT